MTSVFRILDSAGPAIHGEPFRDRGSNPEDGHVVGCQVSIMADQGQALRLGLGNQHAIEGILVVVRQV